MIILKGVYTYNIPDTITKGIEGVRLFPISENLAPDEFPDPESVTLLIARQGAVNRLLKIFPNIKWLQLLNAGYEKVDLELLKRRNIIFTNASSVYCKTIAEDVIAKMLILARNYPVHFEQQRQSLWPDDSMLPNMNIDLEGKTVGILGAGNIGREIAVRAQAFGMTVIGYDPYVTSQAGFNKIYNRYPELEQVLKMSDFLITCLPVTDETRDIMNEEKFKMMKRSAFFINVARGEIVNENHLIEALNKGHIKGAYIDVCKEEPLPPASPVWKTKNLYITPHRAAYGDLMQKRMAGLIERNIHHYLKNEPLENLVHL
ncbi:MAG: D-2-hydroxyacid dehydrogenase [Clostridiales bacterium]|nr:D-2-hydroxyacid dehydrogenase [Clostridiales bacterium]